MKNFGGLSTNCSLKLADHCSVFRTETTTIKVAENLLLRRAVCFREVTSQSDSRALILALILLTERSRLVNKCPASLLIASSYSMIRLVRVPGCSGITGNCKAVDLLS